MTSGPGFLDEDENGQPRLPRQEASPPPQASEAEDVAASSSPGMVDLEGDDLGGRIDTSWNPGRMPTRSRGAGTLAWIALGLALLGTTWVLCSSFSLFQLEFRRSRVVDAIGLAGFLAALGCILTGAGVELVAYRMLRRVESLRSLLSHPDVPPEQVRRAAAAWVETCRGSFLDKDGLAARIRAAPTTETVTGILSREVCPVLRKAARQAGRVAALEGGALTAVMPTPAFDGALAAWRGLRLMREVATVYGLRPGPIVTLALMRRVAVTAVSASGIALLSQSLTEHVLHKTPLIRHLAAAVPETSIIALRLYRLANIVAEACSPIG